METLLLWLLPVLFAAVAVIIPLGLRRESDPQKRRRLWTMYATEFLIVAVILIPAAISLHLFAAVILLLTALACAEFWRTMAIPRAAEDNSLAQRPTMSTWRRLALVSITLVYPGLAAAHLIRIRALPGGFDLLAVLFLTVEMNDTVASLVGQLIGNRRVFPRLSPQKTLEGLIAGCLCGLLTAVALCRFSSHLTMVDGLLGGSVLLISGIAGDLLTSTIKRRHDVKDFGNVLPWQGGVLDIFDALFFAAPVWYVWLQSTP